MLVNALDSVWFATYDAVVDDLRRHGFSVSDSSYAAVLAANAAEAAAKAVSEGAPV